MISFADAGPQHVPLYDLKELSARLSERAAEWVPPLFPEGRIVDGQLRMANIAGAPMRKKGSCVIELKGKKAGYWYDHSTGLGGGPLSTLEQGTGLTGRDLFDRAAEMVGLSSVPVTQRARSRPLALPGAAIRRNANEQAPGTEQPSPATAHRIQREIDQSIPLLGSRGELYFSARGLPPPRSPDLRFSERLADYSATRWRPGIIARVRAPEGHLLPPIHRTFLRDDCRAKADMPKPRKLLGPSRGGVIALAPISPEGVLGVAEGIETSLAATLLFNLPCWATISAGGMRVFAEALARGQPPGLKDLRIFADRGDDGEDAAEFLRCRAQQLGIAAQVFLPLSDDDFNKDLCLKFPVSAPIGPRPPGRPDIERFMSREEHEREIAQALEEFYAAGRRCHGGPDR
jgi:putative DNA primase/helicase